MATYIPAQIVQASISSCSAIVFQHTVAQGSNTDFEFQVTNTSSSSIQWIKVTRPSGNFINMNGNISYAPWGGSSDSESSTFSGGTISPGSSLDHIFENADATTAAPTANWAVEVSDDSGGVNPVNCTGSLGTSISSPAPAISNIAVAEVSSNGVVITWDTDVDSTSQINYGTDSGYGKASALNSAFVSSHSVKLTGLKPNTGYHFQVLSATSGGGSASSGDSTFLTAVEQAAVTQTIMLPGLNVQVSNPADKTPPTIAITSILPKIVKTIPIIKGSAGDDLAVVRIEYSTDGGQNWLPVDSAPKLGAKQVDFSFTPANPDDGDYQIQARAIDAGGNITATAPVTVVIDRLHPIVGGSVINLGPQILKPDNAGALHTTIDLDQKITLSAVGGPTAINLTAISSSSKLKTKSFALTQSDSSGLWQGILSFGEPGNYNLTANAEDGAGNQTSRVLATVEVSGAGKVIKAGANQAIKDAKVVVYYLEPESGDWLVWDGAAYSQTNPQKTDKNGEFNLFLPAGKYYLKASAAGYRTLTSDSFTIQKPTPVSASLALRTHHSLKLGRVSIGWPNFSTQKISLNAPNTSVKPQVNSLVGKQIPTFWLTDTNGKKINSLDWLGKPTVISLNATWSPETIDQLKALGQLQPNNNLNAIAVGLQQTASQLGVYNDVFGLNLTWLPDPDGTLVNFFNAQALPTNYFIDRTGVIKKVVSSPLTKQQLLDNLTGL